MAVQDFWKVIDSIWEKYPEINQQKIKAISERSEDNLREIEGILCSKIIPELNSKLNGLSKKKLTGFIRNLEERFFNIDRQEIQEFTDGADDGFMYCRGFIIGLGSYYYNLIDENPENAFMDFECEEMCFDAYQIFEEKFSIEFERGKFHNIGSCSNAEKWNF